MEKITRGKDAERCIALIDYENCSNLKNISLKEYTELIIFTGPLQQNVVLPVNLFPDNLKISIRQTSGVSKNNIDFHLVLEPGRMTCCGERDNAYHIISADKGYGGVIQTLCRQGIQCRRVTPERTFLAASPVICIDVIVRRVDKIQLYAREPRNMPALVRSFNNYLKSQMREEWSETLAKDIRDELIRRRVIKVKESKITWSSLSNRK